MDAEATVHQRFMNVAALRQPESLEMGF